VHRRQLHRRRRLPRGHLRRGRRRLRHVFFEAGFEGGCPGGWTLGSDWECSTPVARPRQPHRDQLHATQIDAAYNNSPTTAVADSPPINLGQAAEPVLSFWV
jgi:hypothetical protein